MRMIISARTNSGSIMNIVGDFSNKESALNIAARFSKDLIDNTELRLTNKSEIVELEKWAKTKQ